MKLAKRLQDIKEQNILFNKFNVKNENEKNIFFLLTPVRYCDSISTAGISNTPFKI